MLPAFHQFCRDKGLNLQGCDPELHEEATELFNQLKPHYSFFRGHIIHFHVWSWDRDLLQTSQPIEEFLVQAAQDQERLQKFEKWFEIAAAALVFALGFGCLLVFDRWTYGFLRVPDWLTLAIITVAGWAAWRWFFVTRPQQMREKNREKLENQMSQFRQKLADIHISKEIKASSLAEAARPRLAAALAEHILNRLGGEANDSEMQRYVLHDINALLLTAGPGSEVEHRHLISPDQLRSHLRASLEIPAQVLGKELPERLTAWLKAEPSPNHPDRRAWAETGRMLLDLARLNPKPSE